MTGKSGSRALRAAQTASASKRSDSEAIRRSAPKLLTASRVSSSSRAARTSYLPSRKPLRAPATAGLASATTIRLMERTEPSDLHHLFLFLGDDLVHLRDAGVGLLLDPLAGALVLVLGDLLVLEQGLELLVRVAALVADGDLVLLALGLHLLGDLLAPLLGERRDRQTDDLAVIHRSEAQVRLAERLLHVLEEALLPGLHRDEPGLGNGEAGHAAQRSGCPVVVDPHALEEAERGTAGADLRQLALEVLQRSVDAPLEVLRHVVRHRHVLPSCRGILTPSSCPSHPRAYPAHRDR